MTDNEIRQFIINVLSVEKVRLSMQVLTDKICKKHVNKITESINYIETLTKDTIK